MLVEAVIKHRAADDATVARAAGTLRSPPAVPLDLTSFTISDTLLNTVTSALHIAAVQNIPRQLISYVPAIRDNRTAPEGKQEDATNIPMPKEDSSLDAFGFELTYVCIALEVAVKAEKKQYNQGNWNVPC
jgi:hypothetical protein